MSLARVRAYSLWVILWCQSPLRLRLRSERLKPISKYARNTSRSRIFSDGTCSVNCVVVFFCYMY